MTPTQRAIHFALAIVLRHYGDDIRVRPLRELAAEPERQPLTDEQVYADDGIMECNAHIGAMMNELMRLVRAVELAHGITGEQK